MEDGSSIAFFEIPQAPGEMKEMIGPQWAQHFAFEVESVDVLLKAKDDIKAKGVDVIGPVNHDDFIQSIYFFDPSGHRLELATRTMGPTELKKFEIEAPQGLDLWEQTHDWSQRVKLFGSQSGYDRAKLGTS